MNVEAEVIKLMKQSGIDLVASLPCDRIKTLLTMLDNNFYHLPLSREENGVGICAGWYMAGGKPAMLIQSGGIGNSVNALLSLNKVYDIPLPIFVSQ